MQLGMYVAAADLAVARTFYSGLFGVEPDAVTDTFVGFGLAGGRFGILKQTMYAVPLVRGNNVVVNLQVDDVDAEYERVKALGPSLLADAIQTVGPMRLFMFKDPDGNVVELFSMTS